MKILHTADIHLGAYVGPQCDDPIKRMDNTKKCLDALVNTSRQEKPDITLISGDIFHTSKVWADRAMVEVRTAIDYISLLASYAPVAILYGTPNHDNLESFKMMEEAFGKDFEKIQFFYEPTLQIMQTKSGPIQIGAVPGFDKGHFRALFPGLSAEEENKIFSQQVAQIIEGLSAQIDLSMPSVLMAHHTVVGCELDNGQHVFQANEVVIESETLDNSDFDLVCLGHIHKAQQVKSCIIVPTFYSGSIDSFTFNDEDHAKGFYIHDLDKIVPEFIYTPAKEFITAKWGYEAVQSYIENGLNAFANLETIKDRVVRVLYTCDAETEKALDKKKLERDFYDAGAYYVSEIRPEKIETSVNRGKLHEKLTVRDCLVRYLEEKQYESEDINKIIDEVLPILEKVEASIPAGGQIGLFLPVSLDVKNYRSYAQETLEFGDIYFAMVNGRNGCGKSSLFMDAIVDCLYEQPREGELTGWIRNGEKSGSISFTFQLGNSTYRVTRTRQRSGKATLSISKLENLSKGISYNKDFPLNWTDISCQKLVDTQDKIEQLLGMDAETFKSCVLIMQDQYGKFMEAKPEDRMSVLASLLGLGIYERLENETKTNLTEVNRSLKTIKEDISSLDQDVKCIDDINQQTADAKGKLQLASSALELIRKDRDIAAAKVENLEKDKKEQQRLLQESEKLSNNSKVKQDKFYKLVEDITKTKSFLANESLYSSKHEEYITAKEQLAAMQGNITLLHDKQQQEKRFKSELAGYTSEKTQLEKSVDTITQRLSNYDNLISKADSLKDVESDLIAIKEKAKLDSELSSKVVDVMKNIDLISSRIKDCERQSKILKDSACLDIEQASCNFLKSAKESFAKLPELNKQKEGYESELTEIQNKIADVNYSYSEQTDLEKKLSILNNTKQQIAALDGDKKLLEVHQNRITNLADLIESSNTSLENISSEINELQKITGNYYELLAKIPELQPYEEKWLRVPAGKAYLEATEPQVEELQKEIDDLVEESGILKDKAATIYNSNDFDRYEEELQKLNGQISNYESTISGLYRQIGSMDERLTALKAKEVTLKEKRKAIDDISAKATRLQLLSEAFGQDGIPHQIIRDIIPDLEASANEILSQMTAGRMRLEFRTERTLKSNKSKEIATIDIIIVDVDHGELPYLSRSGGQKVRAALAVSFALAIIKASRVGLQLGMMFVDEPPFLDAEGIEAYCGALESIHERYPDMRIVAISHDENMKSAFPQQIYIEATENGSKVRR